MQIGSSASGTLALLALVEGATLRRCRVVLSGEKTCEWPQKWGQGQMWTEQEAGALRAQVTGRERERPDLWPHKCILRREDGSAHDALRFREFLSHKAVTKVEHPRYSSDSRCDF